MPLTPADEQRIRELAREAVERHERIEHRALEDRLRSDVKADMKGIVEGVEQYVKKAISDGVRPVSDALESIKAQAQATHLLIADTASTLGEVREDQKLSALERERRKGAEEAIAKLKAEEEEKRKREIEDEERKQKASKVDVDLKKADVDMVVSMRDSGTRSKQLIYGLIGAVIAGIAALAVAAMHSH